MIDFLSLYFYIPRKENLFSHIYTEYNLDNINKTFPKLYGFTKYIYKPNQKTLYIERRTR